MTHDEYCLNVCGGKCCRAWDYEEQTEKARCCNLGADNKCSIYAKWVDGYCGQTKATIGFDTMPITKQIAEGRLAKWIEDKCCYAHPELLG